MGSGYSGSMQKNSGNATNHSGQPTLGKSRGDVNLTAPILSFSGPNLHAHVTSGPGVVNGSEGGNPRNNGVLRTGTAASTGHVPAALT